MAALWAAPSWKSLDDVELLEHVSSMFHRRIAPVHPGQKACGQVHGKVLAVHWAAGVCKTNPIRILMFGQKHVKMLLLNTFNMLAVHWTAWANRNMIIWLFCGLDVKMAMACIVLVSAVGKQLLPSWLTKGFKPWMVTWPNFGTPPTSTSCWMSSVCLWSENFRTWKTCKSRRPPLCWLWCNNAPIGRTNIDRAFCRWSMKRWRAPSMVGLWGAEHSFRIGPPFQCTWPFTTGGFFWTSHFRRIRRWLASCLGCVAWACDVVLNPRMQCWQLSCCLRNLSGLVISSSWEHRTSSSSNWPKITWSNMNSKRIKTRTFQGRCLLLLVLCLKLWGRLPILSARRDFCRAVSKRCDHGRIEASWVFDFQAGQQQEFGAVPEGCWFLYDGCSGY